MLKLLTVELNKIVYFDHAKIHITKSPLTFLRGLNLDSDPASPSSNGAGKTLLMSTIPNVFYSSTPLAIKKRTRKDILGKGSSITLTFRAEDGSRYKIVQTPSKYSIIKDGEDLEVKKISTAEAMIRNLFPLSEVLFYSTCYVSTQRPFPFQQDSDSARLEHLIDMFRLDQYDRIRDYFSQKLREIKDNEVRLSVLEQRLSILEDKIKAARSSASNIDPADLQSKVEAYEAKIQGLEKQKHDLNVVLGALKTLLEVERELDELRSKYSYKDAPGEVLRRLKGQRALVRSYESYLTLKEQYEKSKAAILKEIQSLVLPEASEESCEARRRTLTEALRSTKVWLDNQKELALQYKEVVREGNEVVRRLLSLGIDVKRGHEVDLDEDFDSQLAVCRTTLGLEKLLQEQHAHGGGTCPTCLSEIDLKSTREAIRAAKKAIPKLEQRSRAQSLYKEYLDLKKKLSLIEFNPKEFEATKAKLVKLEDELKEVEESLGVWNAYKTYTKSLASLKKPAKVALPDDIDLSSSEIDDEIELCSDILKHLEAKAKLTQTHPELADLKKTSAITSAISRITKEREGLEDKLLKIRKSLSWVTRNLEVYSTISSELKMYTEESENVQKEVAKLRPTVRVKRLIEVLLKAYGAKGLRTIVANEICGLIETNLNHYRGLVFAEPFVFSVRASELGLSIIVDRGNGKISDVRTLSGAESNFFRMLFVLSVLPLLPSDRRTNFLVLDEPTSHADEVSRMIFRERFLPAIQQIVPHTFIITPHADDFLPGSKEWLVKKQNGVSEVIAV